MKSILNILILSVLLITNSVIAQIPSRPNPEHLYNNLSKTFPDFLSRKEANQLEKQLQRFSNETSNQICIVITDDLNGLDASSFAVGILNQWGIGQKDKNNGVVILVKPTGKPNERKLLISVGYGLEGAITDIETKHIREEQIVPNFKKGLYFDGLEAGCEALMLAAKGEYNEKTQ